MIIICWSDTQARRIRVKHDPDRTPDTPRTCVPHINFIHISLAYVDNSNKNQEKQAVVTCGGNWSRRWFSACCRAEHIEKQTSLPAVFFFFCSHLSEGSERFATVQRACGTHTCGCPFPTRIRKGHNARICKSTHRGYLGSRPTASLSLRI